MYAPSFINIDRVVFGLLITQIITNYPLDGAIFYTLKAVNHPANSGGL